MKTLWLAFFLLFGCNNMDNTASEKSALSSASSAIDLQGHRGCRGLYPENTVPAFIEALKLGVTTLEMDVVITKDRQVILSHEPFLSHEICLNAQGEEFPPYKEKETYNLYKMTYPEISACDCGSKIHPRFPDQKKIKVHKPLLKEVIDSVEAYISEHHLPAVKYNIEIKSTPEGDAVFHPAPEEFVDMVVEVLKEKKILSRTILQSFDMRPLRYLHKKYPEITLSLLVENLTGIKKQIELLGFVPNIYSPEFHFVNAGMIEYARSVHMKVIPWTVNDIKDMKRLIGLGVDGLISDYPNLYNELK